MRRLSRLVVLAAVAGRKLALAAVAAADKSAQPPDLVTGTLANVHAGGRLQVAAP